MTTTSQILLSCSDPKLVDELEAALGALGDSHPVVHCAHDFRQAAEAARSRRPDLALVEMTGDLRMLKAIAEEIAAGSPETAVVAIFRPDVFGPDVSESAVLIEAIRAGVKDFLRRPISSQDVRQLVERLFLQRDNEPKSLGRIVAMISNKGGVGKSTLSVNTAAGLAMRYPGRVLLVDASLQMGVCSMMLDLHPRLTISDAHRQQDRLDETLIRELATPHPSGLHLLAAPENAVEAAEIDDEMIARVLTLARRAYDFVIVDTFPLLDRINMAVLDLSERVYIVLENVVPAVISGAMLIKLLDEFNFDAGRQRVVLNRYSSRGGNLKPIDAARRLGRNIDHVLPFNVRLQEAANTGRPYVMRANRFTTLGHRLLKLIEEVDQLSAAPRVPVHETNGRAAHPTARPVG